MNVDINFLAGLSCGLCLGITYFALKSYVFTAPAPPKPAKKTKAKFSSRSEYKMVLVVRNDLSMAKGKIMSQCCHAAVGAFKELQKTDRASVCKWQNTGQAKVAVKSNSLEEVNKIADEADHLGISVFKVVDDAKTQGHPETLTCLAVGPAPKEIIDKITGHLKLL